MISKLFKFTLRRAVAFASLGGTLAVLSGCATATAGREKVPMATGRVLSREELRALTSTLFFGDETYAEVNSHWLRQFYADYQTELFRLGVTRADEHFDCNRFTTFYTGLAQARFFREAFYSGIRAQAPAIGPYWYMRPDGKVSHAIIQAVTERGRIFIDPQTGAEVKLTPREVALAYFQFF